MGDVEFTELSPEIEKLAKKWEKDPTSKVFAQLGDLYRKAKLYDEAVHVLTKGLEVNPGYVPGHLVLAKTYNDQLRPAMAKEELEKVIDSDPQNLVALRLMATIVEKTHDEKELIRIYEMILSVDPSDHTIMDRLNQMKKSQPKEEKSEVQTDEFRVDTFQQFRPPTEKVETDADMKIQKTFTPTPEVSETTKETPAEPAEEFQVEPLAKKPTFRTDLPEEKIEIQPYVDSGDSEAKPPETEELQVEPLDKKPTFRTDLPEEKIEIQPYVDKPGGDVKPSESESEAVEEKLEIQRDVSFAPADEKQPIADGDIDTSIMGQLTNGKEMKTEEVIDEKIDNLQTDLLSQMGSESTEESDTAEIDKIDTDIMGQLTGEPTTTKGTTETPPEPSVSATADEKIEPFTTEDQLSEKPTEPKPESPVTPSTPQQGAEGISSIDDILEPASPEEEVPTVDEILQPEEKEPEPKKPEKESNEDKDSFQSFRDWLDGLSK